MSLIILLLLQLWNQPSVRMLGFGRDFAGLISDPITDLLRNPAFLKDFGSGYEKTFNTLQAHAVMQKTDDIDSIIPQSDIDYPFFKTAEPLSFFVFYPKIGLGMRAGAFSRCDPRNYSYLEQWLYYQGGFFGALRLGKFILLGSEYNLSFNNRPDEYEVTVWDSLNNPYSSAIWHSQSSNEIGIGIIIRNNKTWQIAFSAKKNLEKDMFDGYILWPDDWQEKWSEHREDFNYYISIKFKNDSLPYQIIYRFDYHKNMWIHRPYYAPEESIVTKFSSFEPGAIILYQPHDDLMTSVGVVCCHRDYMDYYTMSVALLFGFELQIGALARFRFGNVSSYIHTESKPYIIFPRIFKNELKNELSFGVDFYLNKKMCLNFATKDPLNYRSWIFALNFTL